MIRMVRVFTLGDHMFFAELGVSSWLVWGIGVCLGSLGPYKDGDGQYDAMRQIFLRAELGPCYLRLEWWPTRGRLLRDDN